MWLSNSWKRMPNSTYSKKNTWIARCDEVICVKNSKHLKSNIHLGIYKTLPILIDNQYSSFSQDFGRSPAYLQRMRAEAADEARRLVKANFQIWNQKSFHLRGSFIKLSWSRSSSSDGRRSRMPSSVGKMRWSWAMKKGKQSFRCTSLSSLN